MSDRAKHWQLLVSAREKSGLSQAEFYAAMLQRVSRDLPGSYVTHPPRPEGADASTKPHG